jgi:hypothetical protein
MTLMARASRAIGLQNPEQDRIAAIRQLREQAIDLRENVSAGSYSYDDLVRFHKLIEIAESTLEMPNSMLSERAGLGGGFFATVARDGRSPKLHNFLRALTSIIEISNERLVHVDARATSSKVVISSRIEEDRVQLLSLAQSLVILAHEELARLDANLPNDPERVEKYKKQRELMQIFADGFEQITKALTLLETRPHEPMLLGRAGRVVRSVGEKITSWCRENGTEAMDWAVRVPVFAGGVAMLGWAGADMTVGTTAMAALVGGQRVLNAIQNRKKDR